MSEKYSHVLVVEDDPDMQETINNILKRDQFLPRFANNGKEMHEQIRQERPFIVLLDLILPDENGLDLARQLRTDYQLPFVIISGKDDVIDKVVGLEIGADDYITKPFHARELIARLHTVIRRLKNDTPPPAQETAAVGDGIRIGDWTLDQTRQVLQKDDGNPVNLTTHEFKVLDALVGSAGKILSRDRIIDIVSGRDWMPYDRSVDVVIGKLRKKLDDDPTCPVYIKTVRNAGYSFVAKIKKT
ncbi:MAG: response regulator transcription factor [Rhodospirillales bacterium]|jgi:DNA-binding response OmpR family regulator|nr:response regulator transcription factor [Rhodospirillales bacterium]